MRERTPLTSLQAPTLPLLLPGVWDAADDGAEHEGCDKGKEGQVDEALHTIVAEARQCLHVVLSGKNKTGDGRELRTGGEIYLLGHTGYPLHEVG